MLKVAIDLDGTLFQLPDLWVPVAKGLQSQGATVGILTARNQDSNKRADLTRLRDSGFDPDFYIGRSSREMDIQPQTWKGQKMHSERIDFLFDDFGTRQAKLWTRDQLYRMS